MANISLTASMRSNLLSLQNTSKLMEQTQERLSTGNKVNSALDNPSSYYTARSLNNRAGDLNSLLDSMGQGISTVKAANEGIESITSFVEQAKAVANSARDNAAKDVKASGTFKDEAAAEVEHTINLGADFGNQSVTVTSSKSGDELAAEIQTAVRALGTGYENAEVTFDGTKTFTIDKDNTNPGTTTTTYDYEAPAGTATGTTFTANVSGLASPITIDVADADSLEAVAEAITEAFTDLVDDNGNEIPGISAAVKDGELVISSANGYAATFSGTAKGLTLDGTVGSESRINYMGQYNDLLEQITDMAQDSSYKGVNLLQNDDLTVVFNEDRSSNIVIEGVDASAEGLKLEPVESWGSNTEIDATLDKIDEAINSLRNMASKFGNSYSILQTREDFTENLVNVLEEGADKLVLADMNEESANMLALQTRQQLAVNSLSLASQASQSVLQLFS